MGHQSLISQEKQTNKQNPLTSAQISLKVILSQPH